MSIFDRGARIVKRVKVKFYTEFGGKVALAEPEEGKIFCSELENWNSMIRFNCSDNREGYKGLKLRKELQQIEVYIRVQTRNKWKGLRQSA